VNVATRATRSGALPYWAIWFTTRTAHHHCFRAAGHDAGLLRVGDAKANGDGQGRVPANLLRHGANRVGNLGLHAGDAFSRNVVNESACPWSDERDALIGVVGATR
jgi:hypothetical protein